MGAPICLYPIVSIPLEISNFLLGKSFVLGISQSESGGAMQHPKLSVREIQNSEWVGDYWTQTVGSSPLPCHKIYLQKLFAV